MRKGFETREGHLGKVKTYIAGSCCLYIIGEGRVSHSKKSHEQTGRQLQAGHRPYICPQRSVKNRLGMIFGWLLGYTPLSLLKQLSHFMFPHEKTSSDSQGQALLALRDMGSCPGLILTQLEMGMLCWHWRISPGPQPHGSTALSLLSFPFGSGVHLNLSSQIEAPRQLPTNYQVDLPQFERSNSTDKGSFTPVVEI